MGAAWPPLCLCQAGLRLECLGEGSRCFTSAEELNCLQEKSPALLRILHSEPTCGPQPCFSPRPGFWGLLGPPGLTSVT